MATCFQNEIADPLNSWNGATGTFTAPSTGMYQIAINTLGNVSAGIYGLPMLDLSPIGTSGEEDFYGLGQSYSTVSQNVSKLRGSLNYFVYFTAGQQFTLRIGSGSTVVGFSPLINGSNSITIVKL